MINIVRGPAPDSLKRPDIQNYLQELQKHLADTEAHPRPPKPGTYRNSDLLAAFDRDFFAKCYLTESSGIYSNALDVEHFQPKGKSPELEFAWENLYPCDPIANGMRPKTPPLGGYLDPCAPDPISELLIQERLPSGLCRFQPRDPMNIKAANTAKLLDRVHNGYDENTSKRTAKLRNAISTAVKDLRTWTLKHQQAIEKGNESSKRRAAHEIRQRLSKRSPFTALLRSHPVAKRLPPEFFD